ncbi:MAG: transposase [Vicinamibacterales bacterium]
MARPPRIQLPSAIYHVMSRGNRKGIIFDDDDDRRRFMEVLADAVERYRLRCLSYCLMGNHYHVVIETTERNLPDAMHFVNGVFTQASNLRHGRTGHLLEGRYRSVVVDNDIYLWNAVLYVVLNPVAAGLVTHPADWPWSSFRATAGLEEAHQLLCLDWLDWVIGGRSRDESQRRFREMLGTPLESAQVDGLDVFGGKELKAEVRQELGARFHQIRVPQAYKALSRPTLAEIFAGNLGKRERDERAIRAHVIHGYRLSEIAGALRIHPNTLSRIVRTLRQRSA